MFIIIIIRLGSHLLLKVKNHGTNRWPYKKRFYSCFFVAVEVLNVKNLLVVLAYSRHLSLSSSKAIH